MLFYTESPLKFAFSREANDFNYNALEKSVDDPQKPVFGIVGVPFDSTTTYKPGARFGPRFVREASYNFERYNFILNKNLDAEVYDLGDVEVVHGNFQKTSKNVESTISEILDMEMVPVTIGGEHSISYSVLKAIANEDVTVIHFDAHCDLIDRYMDEKYSHATVMRRIFDLNPREIIQIGVRSASEEEAFLASKEVIKQFKPNEVRNNLDAVERVIKSVDGPVYVSLDLDVLDPAYAPSVGTPAPCGLNPHELERLIFSLKNKDIIGFDLVEVSSTQMGDITSINGAKAIYDFLCLN
ncbi:agmatinase [Methanobacterium aggregans]|uniref:agmatinase n=1 Tax=Methanobacterium aggregans TaxID=1615586 RepID=UPI001AE7548E|nr:agmatinase [Methanobacterium aggregans]MBP2045671.1 agmatinase [Methanobacterium aggregans]